MKMSRKLYFAYGANTNMDGMRYRCPDATPIGVITLPDYELVFRSVADIELCAGARVTGLLWSITRVCEQALDVFEGYPTFYTKEYFDISHKGRIEPVMFYKMVDNTYRYPPNKSYESCLRQGYTRWNIPQSQIDHAIDFSLA